LNEDRPSVGKVPLSNSKQSVIIEELDHRVSINVPESDARRDFCQIAVTCQDSSGRYWDTAQCMSYIFCSKRYCWHRIAGTAASTSDSRSWIVC